MDADACVVTNENYNLEQSGTWSELDIKWHVFKSTFEAPDTSVNMTMR